jgi:hypothetical protein
LLGTVYSPLIYRVKRLVNFYYSPLQRKNERFAGALDDRLYRRKERMTDPRLCDQHSFHPEPSQPILTPMRFLPRRKEGEKIACEFYCFVYRFLSIRTNTSPTTTIATIAPAPSPNTYVSVIGAGVGDGIGVTTASSTMMSVSS